jgi:hypothetical protein
MHARLQHMAGCCRIILFVILLHAGIIIVDDDVTDKQKVGRRLFR